MPEAGGVEVERRQLLLAADTFRFTLVAERVAEAEYGAARITRDQHVSTRPKQRYLAKAIARHVNDLNPAVDRQHLTVGHQLVDDGRFHPGVRWHEQAEHELAQEARRRLHRTEFCAGLRNRAVVRMHPGLRAVFCKKQALPPVCCVNAISCAIVGTSLTAR